MIAYIAFALVGIFTVWQIVLLVQDVRRNRKNKSAVKVEKSCDLKGDKTE